MTEQEIINYLRGRTPRKYAVNPMATHGEIKAPAFLVSNNSPVQLHKPTK